MLGASVLMLLAGLVFGAIGPPLEALGAPLRGPWALRLKRISEFVLYFLAGAVVARYLLRFVPVRWGDTPVLTRNLLHVAAAVLGSVSHGLVGVLGANWFHYVAPVAVFVATVVVILWFHATSRARDPAGGSILFLRRFGTFADRSVVAAVLASAPARTNVTFLVQPGEPSTNWDPLTLGWGGFRVLHPISSIPTYRIATDSNWDRAISEMVRRARVIVIDLSNPSESIRTELSILRDSRAIDRTVFLVSDSSDALPRGGDGGEEHASQLGTRSHPIRIEVGSVRTIRRAAIQSLCLAAVTLLSLALTGRGDGLFGLHRRAGWVSLCFYAPLAVAVALFARDMVFRCAPSAASVAAIRRAVRNRLLLTEGEFPRVSGLATFVDVMFVTTLCGFALGALLGVLGGVERLQVLPQDPGTSFDSDRVARWGGFGMLWGSLVGVMVGMAYAHNANNRYEARTYFAILLGAPAAIGCVAGIAVPVAQFLDPGLQPFAKLLSAPEFALSAYGTLAVLAGAARAISAQPPEGGWPDFRRQPRL